MNDQPKNIGSLIWFLTERAKELNCLYKIEELLNRPDTGLADICRGVIEAIPPGWQYPDVCVAKITLEGYSAQSPNFKETPWVQYADIKVQDKKIGRLSIYYTAEMPHADDGPFLKEETKLLGTIVERLGHYLLYSRMKQAYQEFQSARRDISTDRAEEWRVALNFLRQTNKNLFLNISRRMLNFLSWGGIQEAEALCRKRWPDKKERPSVLTMTIFLIRSRCLPSAKQSPRNVQSGGQTPQHRADSGQRPEVDSGRAAQLSGSSDQPESSTGSGG